MPSWSALTTYLVDYHYDMGPDFVRNIGVANLTGGASGSGPGSAYPSIRTGNHLYWQVGWLLPYHYFLGHHSSLALNWRNRPVFRTSEIEPDTGDTVFVPSTTQKSRGNDIILQLMIYL